MTSLDNLPIKSVQIIKINDKKFTFDYEALNTIINNNNEYSNYPLCVIIINGALRTGKSFFSNFIIRHLLDLENNNNSDNTMLTDYFTSRRGKNIQTLGVWVLNKIFIRNNKAILLMDTQGVFDQELNQAMTVALISLSTIISSYQIYNLDKRIQEDYLCNMANFSSYTSSISNINKQKKIGNTLCLLVRDWEHFDNNFDMDKCNIETDTYRRELLCDTSMLTEEQKETRQKIFNIYNNVLVRLCPHPGHLVTENKFSGRLTDVRQDFKLHVGDIINRMLLSIKPKKILNGQYLLCRDFPSYLQQCINLYDNIEDTLPQTMTQLETTVKISQTKAIHDTVLRYINKMNKYINSKDSNNLNISTYHTDCKRDAIKYFNKLYIMGNDEERKTTYQDMITEITNEYNIILKNIKYDNRYNIAKLIINNIYKCNKNIFSTNTILMSVFLSIVYMIIIFFLS